MTILLHGFWGQPKDWNPVIEPLPLNQDVWVPDLYEPGPLSPNHSLMQWTDSFLQQLQGRSGDKPVQLVGYSMGGRLALNALVRAPHMFSRALLLSAAPYLPDAKPDERAIWEKDWANRFLNEDWPQLENAWQEQPVLNPSTASERRHFQSLREMLALSLSNWSIRHHPFAEAETKALASTVDWAFGALDQKYVELAKTLQELPVQGQITVIPNAGHRLTIDAAPFISAWISGG